MSKSKRVPGSNDHIHIIQDGDSLLGLSLSYGVKERAIKKANGLSTDDIYFMKEIIIPNPSKLIF